jgi:hypothetical protein
VSTDTEAPASPQDRIASVFRSLLTPEPAPIAAVEWALRVFGATVAKTHGGRTLHFATWSREKMTFCGDYAFWRGGSEVGNTTRSKYCAKCVRSALSHCAEHRTGKDEARVYLYTSD